MLSTIKEHELNLRSSWQADPADTVSPSSGWMAFENGNKITCCRIQQTGLSARRYTACQCEAIQRMSVRGDTAHVSARRDTACQSEGVEDFIKTECLELREP